MATIHKNLSEYDESNIPSAEGMRIGLIVAEWNKEITFPLYEGCLETLIKHGATAENQVTLQVPGTFELTAAARILVANQDLDAVVCIGCVIKGETSHNEYINMSVAQGLTMLGMQTSIPMIFGVLTPNSMEQAIDRAGGKHGNKGVEAAVTAIRMVDLKKKLQQSGKSTIGF